MGFSEVDLGLEADLGFSEEDFGIGSRFGTFGRGFWDFGSRFEFSEVDAEVLSGFAEVLSEISTVLGPSSSSSPFILDSILNVISATS